MKKVLVIEDEQSIVKLLRYNIEQEGYEVETALDGQMGYEMAWTGSYDMIILDLMLPEMSGIDICKQLRQEKVDTPIIMLTAKDSEVDKIVGLELGADDYMTKPFSPREVLARMKAIFRRSERVAQMLPEDIGDERIMVGTIEIYPSRYEVIVREESVELTKREFELLVYMAKRQGRVLSRDQLLEAIWGFDYTGGTRLVDVHISKLRDKLEENSKDPHYIKTVRGFGYKLESVT